MTIIENQQNLAKWVRDHHDHLDIAVAFWGEGALGQLGLDNPKKKFRVLLDLGSGGTNPKVVRDLLELKPESVRCVDRLHAKAYIGRNAVAIGSANASANGLGLEGHEATHWHELTAVSTQAQDVRAAANWFNSLWKGSKTITPQLLADAQKKWKRRQQNRPQPSGNSTDLLTAATSDPKAFMNRGIYVTVSTERLSQRAEKARIQKQEETRSPAYMFEHWPSMPVNAHLICFIDFNGKTISRDGPGLFHTRTDKQRGPYYWVDKSNIDGFEVGSIHPWRRRLEKARSENSRKWKSDAGFVMDLGEFVEKYP